MVPRRLYSSALTLGVTLSIVLKIRLKQWHVSYVYFLCGTFGCLLEPFCHIKTKLCLYLLAKTLFKVLQNQHCINYSIFWVRKTNFWKIMKSRGIGIQASIVSFYRRAWAIRYLLHICSRQNSSIRIADFVARRNSKCDPITQQQHRWFRFINWLGCWDSRRPKTQLIYISN